MQNLPSHDELDVLVDELFPALGVARSGDDFFLDPESLTDTTRFYYADVLKWAGVDDAMLPPERVCIHAGREVPANIERQRGGGEGYTLFIDNGLYRSLDAVKLALAHQFAHLRLVIEEQQTLADAQKCRPVDFGDKDEKPQAKKGKAKAKDEDDDEDEAESESTFDAKLAEREIRTEVAAFVLGFGKLILNGAVAWDDLEELPDSFDRVTTLPVASLVHLYKKVADHADVGSKALESGLTDDAKDALGTAKAKAKPKKKLADQPPVA